METLDNIQHQLDSIPFAYDEPDLAAMIRTVESIRALSQPREAVPMLFRWFEDNGQYFLGSPGPFVHFIEEQIDYISTLEQSLARKPTDLTVWMVNRLANAETERARVQRWISVLQQASAHPDADYACKKSADDFIIHQLNRLEA